MNLASPIMNRATEAAGLSGFSDTSFPKMLADASGLWPDQGPEGAFGPLMSALAGAAVAVAGAIALTIYFQTGYRSARDIIRHGLAAAIGLGLLAFVAYEMRNVALAYLGINP